MTNAFQNFTAGNWAVLGVIVLAMLFAVGVVVVIVVRSRGEIRFGKDGVEIRSAPSRDPGEASDETILLDLEVRDYVNVLWQILAEIKKDIKTRIRANGWASMKPAEWSDYVERAIRQHNAQHTRLLDILYYPKALVERTFLYQQNEDIFPDIEALYVEMYNRLLVLMSKTGGKTCDEAVERMDTLMREVEGFLDLIQQKYKSHYLMLYKMRLREVAV